MTGPGVLVTRHLARDAMEYLRARASIEVPEEDRRMPREELLRRVTGKRGLLVTLTDRIDEEVLEAAGPGLVVVANLAVGYDNVDMPACTRRGVLVTNTPDVLTDATADLAWGLILAASRRIVEGDRLIRSGRAWEWSPSFLLGREVTGKTLGVVGFGRIGRAVARRAAGFEVRVEYASRSRAPEAERDLQAAYRELPDLLTEADIVSLHVPLNGETRHLIDADALRRMRPSATLINTSRGPVVDEAALADALRRGEIGAAGLDVYEREPDVHPDLLELHNVVLAPHLGSATVETRTAMAMLAARNLVAALEGKDAPSPVNPEART